MARGRRDGIVIAGGGLAGSLAALAMARHRPDVPLLIIEEAETLAVPASAPSRTRSSAVTAPA
jgi:2-polyprenyl-6-methoxyphenol hydroxylase-like FAD-dependent oxidoreductase